MSTNWSTAINISIIVTDKFVDVNYRLMGIFIDVDTKFIAVDKFVDINYGLVCHFIDVYKYLSTPIKMLISW